MIKEFNKCLDIVKLLSRRNDSNEALLYWATFMGYQDVIDYLSNQIEKEKINSEVRKKIKPIGPYR